MIANKHTPKLILVLTAFALIICLLAIVFSNQLTGLLGGRTVKMEYETALFDTSEPMSVNIIMDEEDWNTMLSNAMSEEYYVCDVVINGTTIKNVAIRPKGNTSLSAIAMDPDTDRYSFKLEFDHFVEGQTCFGLDKLILNNNYADATNMKEAVIYDMFQYLGAEASLYNYAKVSVNGEYWGVYLALEGVEESFMLRNFGTQDGELYKPDSMEMGGGESSSSKSDKGGFGGGPGGGFGGGNFEFDPENMPDMGDFDFSNMPDMGNFGGGDFDTSNIPEREDSEAEGDSDKEKSDKGGGGFSFGNGGANLNYTDDDLDSYSTIWEGEITGTSKADHRRVVTALKNISEGTDLEEYLDVDNILKYMAVHTFSVNMDSLSGSMAHNYYLYEYDGKLNMFPWDYNLSLGGMSMGSSGDATEMVNDPIDTPFSGTQFFDSLLENEEYLAKYHEYLNELVEEYVNGGRFDEVYSRIRSQIDTLVEEDPTAFYSYDEYEEAAETLYDTIKLRAESIEGQLNGSIPSTDSGQRQDSSSLIDASYIDVKVMGQFNMGASFSGGFDKEENSEETAGEGFTENSENENGNSLEKPDKDSKGGFPGGFSKPDGDSNGGFEKPDGGFPGGFGDSENMPDFGGMSQNSAISKLKNLGIYGGCFIAMLIALIIVKCVKRRKLRG